MPPEPVRAPSKTMAAIDRRAEERYNAEGEVSFSFDDPSRQEITGRLADYSNSGFRAIHAYPALHTGQVVEFRHTVSVGKARVMWNRIQGNSVETGFLVLK